MGLARRLAKYKVKAVATSASENASAPSKSSASTGADAQRAFPTDKEIMEVPNNISRSTSSLPLASRQVGNSGSQTWAQGGAGMAQGSPGMAQGAQGWPRGPQRWPMGARDAPWALWPYDPMTLYKEYVIT